MHDIPTTFTSRVSMAKPEYDTDRNTPSTSKMLLNYGNFTMSRLSSSAYFTIYVCVTIVLLGSLLWPRRDQHSGTLIHQTAIALNYFVDFDGYAECNIRANELYQASPKNHIGIYEADSFCHSRQQLLRAMSEGGRVGFDAPYQPRGCQYRWFNAKEMCFILERFDGLLFIGDDFIEALYGGFNLLLRQDLALGALDLSSMPKALQDNCHCDNQFIKQDCRQHFLQNSDKPSQDKGVGSPFLCNRVKHGLLKTTTAEVTSAMESDFTHFVPKAPRSKYRPVPIIHSGSPSTMSAEQAAASLSKFVELADKSERNTPMLWIGPTAAGHIELKDRKGNQEIWEFDRKMALTAAEHDVEVLGMWNMTAQATSWDGMHFAEKIAITQAMMVMNWLSRLESS